MFYNFPYFHLPTWEVALVTFLRRLKLHGQNAPKTASLRHCEKIVLLGGT